MSTYLLQFLELNPIYKSQKQLKCLKEYEHQIVALLKNRDSLGNRHKKWLQTINNNYFGFEDFNEIDRTLNYDPREWFYEAVEAKKQSGLRNIIGSKVLNSYVFKRKEGFNNSDWVKFMRAAAEHKFRVIHKILPELDIYVG